MIMALLGGGIATRLGSKWALAGGLALLGLSSLVFQVQWLGLVIVLWFLGGAGLALVSIGGSSSLTRLSEREVLGVLAAFYALSTTIGGAVGNPIAGVMIERFGFATFSWAAIALSVTMILAVTFLMRLPPGASATGGRSLGSIGSAIWAVARHPNMRFVVGLRSLPTIYYGMLTVHIPLLLNSVSGSKVTVAAYITTNLIVASIAQLLTGRAADRWGARRPSLVVYSLMILSGIGLAATSGTVWGLFVFGVLGIAAAWALSTLMFVWVNDGIPKGDHPATFGLLHAVWSLCMITGSVFGSWFSHTQPGLPFLLIGLLNGVALVLITRYYRKLAAA
jgi:MFS family permease